MLDLHEDEPVHEMDAAEAQGITNALFEVGYSSSFLGEHHERLRGILLEGGIHSAKDWRVEFADLFAAKPSQYVGNCCRH